MPNGNDDTDVTQDDMADDTGDSGQDQDPTYWSSRGEISDPGPFGGIGGGATSTMRNQPMEIPRTASATGPMGGGALAGAMGAGLGSPRPVGSMVTQQHGGLVTGLAGLLVDGLYAGMAPSREAAFEMPMKLAQMRNQQAETEIKQQQLQEEMQEAPIRERLQMAQAQMLELNLHRETEEQGMEDVMGKSAKVFAEKSIESGMADQVATADDYQTAMQTVQNLSAQNQDHQLKLFAYPLTGDVSGKWGVYKAYPEKTLPQAIDVPVPPSPEYPDGVFHIKAGTPMATITAQLNMARQMGVEAAKEQKAGQQNVVVTVPGVAGKPSSLQVMTQSQAKELGQQSGQPLPSYVMRPGDAEKLGAYAAGMNDLQFGVNKLAAVNYPGVQMDLAAALLEQDPQFSALTVNMKAPGRLMSRLRSENLADANQDTRNYVAAMSSALEGITQMPRLQTFGQMSRFGHEQVVTAQNLLPTPGDDEAMAKQKLVNLQTMMDKLKVRTPQMKGVSDLDQSFLEQRGITGDQFQAGASRTPSQSLLGGGGAGGSPTADPGTPAAAVEGIAKTVEQYKTPVEYGEHLGDVTREAVGGAVKRVEGALGIGGEKPSAPAAPAATPSAAPAAAKPAGTADNTNIWQQFKGDTGLNKLADHVISMEGDSRIARENNNPGNLKDPATGKFMKFDSYQEGRDALLRQLKHWRDQHPDWSVSDFNRVYAPNKAHGGDNPDGTEESRNKYLMNTLTAVQ